MQYKAYFFIYATKAKTSYRLINMSPSIDGFWCAVPPSVQLRADSLFKPVDLNGNLCYEFQCSFPTDSRDIEQCYYIETYQSPHYLGGTFTAHSNENAAHDIGAGFRIDDTFKGSDYLDGRHFARASALYDMKLTQDGKLRGWIQEVHGNKQENAFTGVFTLERQGDVKPNFVSRFNKIKNATNA